MRTIVWRQLLVKSRTKARTTFLNSIQFGERNRAYLVFASCQSHADSSAACDNPNLVSIPFLLDKEVLVVMVGVAVIRPFFDWNRHGDIFLSIDGIVAGRDKSLALLDCDGTLMDSTWWQTLYHCLDEETVAAKF